jgi:hypothetical protein
MSKEKDKDKVLSRQRLNKAIAERLFEWQSVHKYQGKLIGKKRDKAGHWRKSRVPDYSGDPRVTSAIDERMKDLGRLERYSKELERITKADDLPPQWATGEHRCQAALKAISSHLRLVRSTKGTGR